MAQSMKTILQSFSDITNKEKTQLQAGVSPTGICFCRIATWVSQNQRFRSLSKMMSILFPRCCRQECPRQKLFLQSEPSAHTRWSSGWDVDTVGSLRLARVSCPFHSMVSILRSFQSKKRYNASELPLSNRFLSRYNEALHGKHCCVRFSPLQESDEQDQANTKRTRRPQDAERPRNKATEG